MTPSNFLLDAMQQLIADDDATLGPPANAMNVHLAKANFTPSPTLTLAMLTEADFPGYALLAAGLGDSQTFVDPVTTLRQIQILEPAGGWHWQATGVPSPSQTIFGFYLTNNGNTQVYGSALFASPITIATTGDGVDIANVRFAMPSTALQ